MMEPLPSSPIDPGRTTAVDPSLQRTVAVAASGAAGVPATRSQAVPAITRASALVVIVLSLICPQATTGAAASRGIIPWSRHCGSRTPRRGTGSSCEPDEARGSQLCLAYLLYVERR